MTDAATEQLAAVVPTRASNMDSPVYGLAAVAVCSEVPPVAGGARYMQAAIVTVSIEFVIPQVYVPQACGQFMQTMPYYIMPFPGE